MAGRAIGELQIAFMITVIASNELPPCHRFHHVEIASCWCVWIYFKIEEFEVNIFHIFPIQGLSDLTRYVLQQAHQMQLLFEGLNTFQLASLPFLSPFKWIFTTLCDAFDCFMLRWLCSFFCKLQNVCNKSWFLPYRVEENR